MAEITKEQKEKIRTLTRRANRRIERSTGGQRTYLEWQVKRATGQEKFSAAYKGMTERQAAAQISKLEKFLGAKTTTKTGWRRAKAQSIRKANENLTGQGYNLTDEELADILEQLDSDSTADFYRAVNLVEAAKEEAGDDWDPTADNIAEIIEERASAQEALERALKAREKKSKQAAEYRRQKQFLQQMGKKKRAKAKLSGQGNKNK